MPEWEQYSTELKTRHPIKKHDCIQLLSRENVFADSYGVCQKNSTCYQPFAISKGAAGEEKDCCEEPWLSVRNWPIDSHCQNHYL